MVEWVDHSQLIISPAILRLIPADVAHQNVVLPVRKDGETLIVAVESPSDQEAMDKLRFILNRELNSVGIPLAQLKLAIWRFYGPPQSD